MKRPVRDPIKGTYTIKDVEYNELFGSREKVMNEFDQKVVSKKYIELYEDILG